jgi:gamma-glutamyltranspeptidase/glutathione hydrolase
MLVSAALALSGCQNANTGMSIGSGFLGSSAPPLGERGHVTGFIGVVVADEPQAALYGRQILSAGGTAADAAAAIGLTLAVTLPSRAGLGGGGACVAYTAGGDTPPQAVMFTSVAPAAPAGADRPAAVPMLARGLFAMQNRFGHLPFETIIQPIEQLAGHGVRVSHALVADLSVVAGPLAGDPGAAAVFFHNGRPLADGDLMVQPDLAATLAELRTSGVGDLYVGVLARRVVAAAPAAGAALSLSDLHNALPKIVGALSTDARNGDKVTFPPPPADGGLAAAAAFQVLEDNPGNTQGANARALAVVSRWRQGGTDLAAVTTAANLPPGSLPSLPASTTFGAIDRDGNAVVCAVTMGNLFGTGRMAPGTGILLAASPAWLPPPLLAVAIAYSPRRQAFHALAGGSGQAGAPLAVAMMISQTLNGTLPQPASVPEPGRANVSACEHYLPGDTDLCMVATDPRGGGMAIGGGT